MPRPDCHFPVARSVSSRCRRSPPSRPIDVAEAFRDLPGLVLLESARPGRNSRWTFLTADPVAVLDEPAAGADPFAAPGDLVATARIAAAGRRRRDAPPFLGGLVGYLAYDLGHSLERLPTMSADDQGLPLLRLALHDWVIAWDRRTGAAWLGGRALDGDAGRLDRRLAEVRERIRRPRDRRARRRRRAGRAPFRSSLDRRGLRDRRRGGPIVHRPRRHLPGEPHPPARDAVQRRSRGRSTAGSGPAIRRSSPPTSTSGAGRAILSASPEPFLSVDRAGAVKTDPIKGTRPRGRSREEDRALACELLASGKDRAENVMIVDVLRNDLGRVCRPGTVRVPRLCRLERTAAVQHLVSTVTGQLAPGRDAFDLLAASFPGGSITGAPKIRAMELLEELEPVRRGPYTGALGWIGPDGAMATSILIRTFVADGARLSLHVGGGITYRSDPAAEWEETVAKARGPLAAIGGTRGRRPGDGLSRPAHVWLDGRLLPADAPHLSAFDRGFQLGDGVFETLRARAGRPTELPEHVARLRRSAAGLAIPLPDDVEARLAAGIAELIAAEGLDGPAGDASIRITVSRGVFFGRGLLPPDERPAGDDRHPGVARAARPDRSPRARPPSRLEHRSGATRRTRCRRSRRRRGRTMSTRGSRRGPPARTTRCS